MNLGDEGLNYVVGTALAWLWFVGGFGLLWWIDRVGGWKKFGTWLKAVLLDGGAQAEPRRRR